MALVSSRWSYTVSEPLSFAVRRTGGGSRMVEREHTEPFLIPQLALLFFPSIQIARIARALGVPWPRSSWMSGRRCDRDGAKTGPPRAVLRDITALFACHVAAALTAASLPAWDMHEAVSEERGHGRHERRRVVASTEPNEYLNWLGVASVFTVERPWQKGGAPKQAVRYGITQPTVHCRERRPVGGARARSVADRESAPLCEGCHTGLSQERFAGWD